MIGTKTTMTQSTTTVTQCTFLDLEIAFDAVDHLIFLLNCDT